MQKWKNIMESHDEYIEWMEKDTNLFKNSFRDLNTFLFFHLNQTFHIKDFILDVCGFVFFKLKAKIR